MSRKAWYMCAYDIADPKRLAQVHGIMKKTGIAAQQSVFFVKGTEQDVQSLLNRLSKVIKNSEDDIRAYPVVHPSKVWTTGGPLETFPLVSPGRKGKYRPSSERVAKAGKKKSSFWKRIFGQLGGK